jgi:hypothetical protein
VELELLQPSMAHTEAASAWVDPQRTPERPGRYETIGIPPYGRSGPIRHGSGLAGSRGAARDVRDGAPLLTPASLGVRHETPGELVDGRARCAEQLGNPADPAGDSIVSASLFKERLPK